MANWCSTSYILTVNEDKAYVLDKIEAAIEKLQKKHWNNWMGDVLKELGIEGETDRDFFTWKEREGKCNLRIDEEGAWTRGCTMCTLVKWFNEHEDANINVLYYSEEPGCEFFQTNDSDDMYYVIDSNCGEDEVYNSLDDVIDAYSELVDGKKVTTLEELNDALDEHFQNEEGGVYVYQYDYIPFEF